MSICKDLWSLAPLYLPHFKATDSIVHPFSSQLFPYSAWSTHLCLVAQCVPHIYTMYWTYIRCTDPSILWEHQCRACTSNHTPPCTSSDYWNMLSHKCRRIIRVLTYATNHPWFNIRYNSNWCSRTGMHHNYYMQIREVACHCILQHGGILHVSYFS